LGREDFFERGGKEMKIQDASWEENFSRERRGSPSVRWGFVRREKKPVTSSRSIPTLRRLQEEKKEGDRFACPLARVSWAKREPPAEK